MDTMQPKTIDMASVEQRIDDPTWCMQQKFDGVRMIIEHNGHKPTAYGRSGLHNLIPEDIEMAIRNMPPCILDGELAWGTYWVFDCLDDPDLPYVKRLERASQLVKLGGDDCVKLVRTWAKGYGKRQAFARARDLNIEGVVFKALSKPWTPGSHENTCCRFKFRHRGECIIANDVLGQRSARLAVIDEDTGYPRDIGRMPLSVAASNEISARQHGRSPVIVEVEYQHLSHKRRLIQAQFVRIREDKSEGDCRESQFIRPRYGDLMDPEWSPPPPEPRVRTKKLPEAKTTWQTIDAVATTGVNVVAGILLVLLIVVQTIGFITGGSTKVRGRQYRPRARGGPPGRFSPGEGDE